MTTAELDSHKMILVREIINHFNTEESLQKLAEVPPQLFQELTETVERQYEAGQCLTDEQLDKVIQAW